MLLTDLRSLHGEGSRPASEGGAMSATKFTFGRGTNATRTGACVQGLGLSLVASRRYGAWVSHFAVRSSGSSSVFTGGRQESGGPHEDHDQDRLISPGLLTRCHPGFHQVKCRSVVAACLLFWSQDTRSWDGHISSERCVRVTTR